MKAERTRKEQWLWALAGVAAIMAILAAAVLHYSYNAPRFLVGTSINGVDCSNLTANEVAKNLSKIAQDVTFSVVKSDGGLEEYKPTTEQIKDFELSNSEIKSIIKHFVKAQGEDSSIKVFYVDVFTVDEENLRDYLATIPELNSENMVIPQNAYLRFNSDNLLEIVEEKSGNQIDFEEAVTYATTQLTHFKTIIDFTLITNSRPAVLASDEKLVQTKERINNCLNTVVNFTLTNGEVVTLDKSITSDWVVEKNGDFEIDESQIEVFVSELAEKVKTTKTTLRMPATDIGHIEVTLAYSVLKVDKEAQIQAIKEYLSTGTIHNVIPKYADVQIEDFFNSYIEVDLARQKVWMYVNGVCVLETDCVTGMANTKRATPTGIYFMYYKTRNAVLSDRRTYWSPVKYWMPFNGGIGFHDAPWKEINGVEYFGGTYYLTAGSHGCVNLPTWAAEIMYQNITKDMPIIVYDSSKIIQIGNAFTNETGSLNPPRLYVKHRGRRILFQKRCNYILPF